VASQLELYQATAWLQPNYTKFKKFREASGVMIEKRNNLPWLQLVYFGGYGVRMLNSPMLQTVSK
jgi:hypothetical protein